MITSITKIQVQLVRRVLVRISNATDAPLHTVSRRSSTSSKFEWNRIPAGAGLEQPYTPHKNSVKDAGAAAGASLARVKSPRVYPIGIGHKPGQSRDERRSLSLSLSLTLSLSG